MAKNMRWIDCSTQEEYVEAMACSRGAARFDQLELATDTIFHHTRKLIIQDTKIELDSEQSNLISIELPRYNINYQLVHA